MWAGGSGRRERRPESLREEQKGPQVRPILLEKRERETLGTEHLADRRGSHWCRDLGAELDILWAREPDSAREGPQFCPPLCRLRLYTKLGGAGPLGLKQEVLQTSTPSAAFI